MNYFDELTRSMTWLGQKQNTLFIGQSVEKKGTAAFNTLNEVPMDKRLELPVAEAMQMGMSCGLSVAGKVPISIFPRLNFMLCAISELVNHLDKYPLISDYKPHVIVRSSIGSSIPLDPSWMHKDDFTEAIKMMCRTVKVKRLESAEDIFPAYEEAYNEKGVTLLVEVADFLNQDFYKNYKNFRNTYKGK
jgi:pyruvate/2-oxoglutarate/acetoin dehydrogenase E1 component